MNISSISSSDYVCLVANYMSVVVGEKDPSIDLKVRGYSDSQIEIMSKSLSQKVVTYCGLRFLKPLYKYKYSQLGYALTLLENYERGQLPFEGSVSEQPAQVMDILGILQNLKNEHKRRLEKRDQ